MRFSIKHVQYKKKVSWKKGKHLLSLLMPKKKTQAFLDIGTNCSSYSGLLDIPF